MTSHTFNALETAILTISDITKSKWFDIGFNGGFTLGYGKIVRNIVEGEDGNTQPNECTCCLRDYISEHHFDNESESIVNNGQYPHYSEETYELRAKLWKRFLFAGDYDLSVAETYSQIISPQVLTALEAKFRLTDGSWFMLPTNCYYCT